MKIALIHPSRLPVQNYGGTERVIWWLAKGLSQKGHQVTLVSRKGSECPFAEVLPWDFSNGFSTLPTHFDIIHFFGTPHPEPDRPYVVTIDGNGQPGEKYHPNTIFVSRNHAERHHAQAFVYNGLDPEEYLFDNDKEDYLVFLGKAKWKVKNVKGAIEIAKKAAENLHIIGGIKLFLNGWNGIFWEGMIGGERKARLLAKAKALLFPVKWEEPFGLAVIESLVSGTPVLAAKRGSLTELVPDTVGKLCEKEEDYLKALHTIYQIKPETCRQWVLENFTYHQMSENYLKCYEKVLSGNRLNASAPYANE